MSTPAAPWRQPAPAFTTVSARRTLSRPDTEVIRSYNTHVEPQPIQSQPPPPRKVDWPPQVREYVQRCFAPQAAIAGIDRAEMEAKLKKILTESAENNSLHVVNWEAYPLPQQIIQQERARVMAVKNGVGSESPSGLAGQTNDLSLSSSHTKKRKSFEANLTEADESNQPPWRKTNNRNVFEDRISYATKDQADRADKRQRKMQDFNNTDKGSSKYQADLEKRKQRFQNDKTGSPSPRPWSTSRAESPSDGQMGPVIGTCQDLEKRYFRLTSAPKPEAVRPLHILKQTLDLLKKKWKKESNYVYICDQFKSLRQDLTVQHIKNEFTVTVYEIHARIALEKGDLGEYNQCQTQLRALYSQSLGGHPAEFLAYRILYLIHTCNRTDMNDVLADLTKADKTQPAVRHALDVRSALAMGNYHKFFRLYLETPNMGAYLMDMFIVRERIAALANICKAYKPDIRVRFLTEELGFESDQDCVEFLCANQAQHLIQENDEGLKFLTGKAGNLFEAARAAAFRKVDIKGQI